MDFKAYLASSSEEEEDEEQTEGKWWLNHLATGTFFIHQECCCVELNVLSAEKPAEPLPEEKRGSKEKKSTEQIAKYRELLKSIQDKDKEKDDSMDMEVTWVPGIRFFLFIYIA